MPTDKDFHFCETYTASVLSYTANVLSNTALDSSKSVSRMITLLKQTLELSSGMIFI